MLMTKVRAALKPLVSILSMLEALRADGIEPDPIIDVGHVTPGCRIVFFRDPEGNILELMEGYRDED